MQHNPYSPPASTELESPPAEAVRRPFAVWLLLLGLGAFGLLGLTGMSRSLFVITPHLTQGQSFLTLAIGIGCRLATYAFALFAAVDIYRRRRWGRWFGLVAIAGLVIFNLLRSDDARYPNAAQRLGAHVGQYFLLTLLLVWWAYAFGFSPKAKRYFSSNRQSATSG